MQYPSYFKYKESNIDWFGDVPADWKMLRLKWTVLSCKNGVWGSEPDLENDIYCIRVADFDRVALNISDSKLTVRAIENKDRKGRLLQKGDLLLEKSGGGEGQLVGAVSLFDLDVDAVSSNFIALMQCDEHCDSRYLSYLHSHLYSCRVNYRSIKQTTGIQNLDSQQYLDELVFLPDIGIQKGIARFLDYKTQQIDQLIEKKKALIEKLNEQRIAVITQAVTKGLDKNAKMKPSGVDWLGDVPEHWEVKRLRFCIISNPVKSQINDLENDSLVSFVPMEAVNEYGGMDVSRVKMLEDVYSGYTYFRENDVVVAKITPCFENGKGSLVSKNLINGIGFGTTEFHVLRGLDSVMNEFLFYITILHSFREIGASEMLGAGGQKRVPENFIKDFRLGIPDLTEQKKIVSYIENSLARSDQMIKLNQQAIDKYEEYRSALITAAVTGKIDVRGFEIPGQETA